MPWRTFRNESASSVLRSTQQIPFPTGRSHPWSPIFSVSLHSQSPLPGSLPPVTYLKVHRPKRAQPKPARLFPQPPPHRKRLPQQDQKHSRRTHQRASPAPPTWPLLPFTRTRPCPRRSAAPAPPQSANPRSHSCAGRPEKVQKGRKASTRKTAASTRKKAIPQIGGQGEVGWSPPEGTGKRDGKALYKAGSQILAEERRGLMIIFNEGASFFKSI